MMVKVAVLGAGINGLASAVKIKEKYPNLEVVLISKDFSPNTTGDGSGGLWYPYLCGNTPGSQLYKWGGETYKFLHSLWLAGGYGVSLIPVLGLHRERQLVVPDWSPTVFGFRELEARHLDYLSRLYSTEYVAGHTFTTFVVQPPAILACLYRRFEKAQGRVLRAAVSSLRDPLLDEFHVIVNCTGLGARELVPDPAVFPIRGQIVKVAAPWINVTTLDHTSGHYIIPNAETCILGGTHQENNFDTTVDPQDSEFILNGCTTMIPGLKHASLVKTWVGLRPGRDEVRIEKEERDGKIYIHNYGHGGSGLTLFWGCATEVLNLLESQDKIIHQINKSKL